MGSERKSIAIVGLGTIARQQHLPAIERAPGFDLAAIVDPHSGLEGLAHFSRLEEMLAARPDIAAVALCTPPQVRFELAARAIRAGRHVLLEKPPGASVGEVATLEGLARGAGVTLFAAWHSRFGQGVAPAHDWLEGKRVQSVRVAWREDVRRHHPGQEWIWQPGGLGVFDPGINAFSILTHILPTPFHVTHAALEVPANRHTPIGARIELRGADGYPVTADFDWREEGPPVWDITVHTSAGTLGLSGGGSILVIDGQERLAAPNTEYDAIYARFAHLIAAGESDVDTAPLQLVADSFMLAETRQVDPFDDVIG